MNSEWWDLTDYEKHPSVLIYFKKWEGGVYTTKNDRTYALKYLQNL